MEAIIVAAELDFASATRLFCEMRERRVRPILLIAERMTGESENLLWEKLCRGAHLFALLTPALVKEQRCIVTLQCLVEKHLQHCNASASFFCPVYFQSSKERRWFLPVFFQGWKGLERFSGTDGAWGAWQYCTDELRRTGKLTEPKKEQACPSPSDANF